MARSPNGTYDYIVVGAGSAGCVMANRLSADPACRVLVLEAGKRERSVMLRMPAAFAYASSNSRYLWGYSTEPEPFLDGRRITCERGRLVGGSSAINAMAYVRGHPDDFDNWAGAAGDQWRYENCLPYFRSLEKFGGGSNEKRGGDGPLSVIAPKYSNPLNEMFLEACGRAGFPAVSDLNAIAADGVGPMDQTIAMGTRASAATAFLDPIRERRNITLHAGVTVTRILLKNARAIGVEFFVNGNLSKVFAGQIILTAGAINSPQLLMVSGIGDADILTKRRIKPLVDLPGVGKNLHDHVDVSLFKRCVLPISASSLLAPHRKLLIGLQWLLTGTGPGATNHFEVAGYVRTTSGLKYPDIQFCFIPLLTSVDGKSLGEGHGYQVAVMLLRPKSRGSITLRDNNPLSPPMIQFNYLEDAADRRSLREGIRTLRRILAKPAIAAASGTEIAPGAEKASDEALDQYIRATAKSTHHPCGSCRMGNDAEAVVDGWGRVHGLEGLRIADASVFPSITGGNINAPTMMVAEKMAHQIKMAPLSQPQV